MKRRFVVTIDAGDDDQTRPNIWRDWVEGALVDTLKRENGQLEGTGKAINIEVAYEDSGVWQCGVYKNGIGALDSLVPATLDEVKAAIKSHGLDESMVEQVDEGVFNIPLPAELEAFLNSSLNPGETTFDIDGLEFIVEMP